MAMININALPGSQMIDGHSGLPKFGKQPNPEIPSTVFPTHQIDYTVGGCPMSWLNTVTEDDAIEFYRRNFSMLPDAVLVGIARFDFHRKNNISADSIPQ
jgi:hypothetical protein